jgi:hypothetical protein
VPITKAITTMVVAFAMASASNLMLSMCLFSLVLIVVNHSLLVTVNHNLLLFC